VLALFITASSHAQEALQLPLKEAIRQAVEKNLDLHVEMYNPAQSDVELRKARGIYDTHLTMNTSYQYAKNISVSATSASDLQTFKLAPGAYQLLPSGGTVSAAFNNTHISTNSALSTADSYWQSDLTLSLMQPLLKNFGRDATELNIQVALQAQEGAMQRYRNTIMSTVAQVQSEYYKLHSLREDLESRKISLELAKRILTDTKARVAAGVLPAMETLNAEFGVSSREKELIDADRAVRDEVDTLRLLVQVESGRDIIPTDPLYRQEIAIVETEAIRMALKNRPELADLQAQVLSAELQERTAKNRTQPDLNLSTSIAVTGLGEGYGRDLERVGSAKYPVWFVGLQFDYPLGNQVAENEYIKSRLRSEQLRAQLKSTTEGLSNEVRSAIRAVQTNYKQLEVSDRNRAYAEERLKAYIKKNEVGLATTKDVLDVENDLSTARSNQIKAQVAYSTAISLYLKTTGELLEHEGITVTAVSLDKLLNNKKQEIH
jgi:outer membrane protein TolC